MSTTSPSLAQSIDALRIAVDGLAHVQASETNVLLERTVARLRAIVGELSEEMLMSEVAGRG